MWITNITAQDKRLMAESTFIKKYKNKNKNKQNLYMYKYIYIHTDTHSHTLYGTIPNYWMVLLKVQVRISDFSGTVSSVNRQR